jgi:hypothetical protein
MHVNTHSSLRSGYWVSFTSSPTASTQPHALLLNNSSFGVGKSTTSAKRPYCRHQVSGAWPSMILTGLPHSAHMLLCIGLPELVLGSGRLMWESEIETCSLGTMKAYEATPPELRLQFEQWHTKVFTVERSMSTETYGIMR